MSDDVRSREAVASLYRRFRPGRFADLRGQEHIVRALQGAVANNRVVHAYLFPVLEGTGKTTTARILAKALNCQSPQDGDACNTCDSCVAITRGSSMDVVELDAASNNGVDDIREITAGAWHGTPGRWKIYIFDEVHMLSKAAEAAFLKTLEEPPPHVIFVLATTDPHKVVSTIRSRTQHLEFRLLDADTLRGLLHDVSDAAHLDLDDATLSAAVRLGRGSARDALSALDQVVATGSLESARPPFDGLLGALRDRDAVATLSALAELERTGWDVEQLAESLAGELRQIFLMIVAPDVADVLDTDRDRVAQWGRELGLPRTVRALETVGRTLREMKGSPVPSVMLEVALVRLTHPELDESLSALEERVARLERGVVAAPSTAPPAPSRPVASLKRPEAPSPSSTPAPAPATPAPATPVRATPSEAVVPAAPEPAAASPSTLDETAFLRRFSEQVLPRLSRSAQVFLGTCRVTSLVGSTVTITVPSAGMKAQSERFHAGLRSALDQEFSMPLHIDWVVDGSVTPSAAPVSAARPVVTTPAPVDHDEDASLHDDDGEDVAVDSIASMLISEAFPGAEEIS